jgi:hypothetical protein
MSGALLHLVPDQPAHAGGVVPFATALAGALRERFDLPGRVVAVPQGGSCDLGSAGAVILHYANYGFARRGCPFALVDALERWRRDGALRRLLVVFHELYATGPPWRSSFWLSPLQRNLAIRLARRADAAVTSLVVYRETLARWRPDVTLLPVFSTVGEPADPPPLDRRPPRLVVLGAPGNRARVYDARARLAAACEALGIEEVVDVGPDAGVPLGPVAGRAVRRLGILASAEASRILLDSRAGALGYSPRFLAKSTVFAAYCAHGILPVCLPRRPEPGEVEAGRHFWMPGPAAGTGDAQVIASAAHAWYQGHSLRVHAARHRELLQQPAREP